MTLTDDEKRRVRGLLAAYVAIREHAPFVSPRIRADMLAVGHELFNEARKLLGRPAVPV